MISDQDKVLPILSRCLKVVFLKSYEIEECLHAWVKVDQVGRPLQPKSLCILSGLTLKLDSLCIIVNIVENI